EQVINNILEDKLVSFLDKLDRTMQSRNRETEILLVTPEVVLVLLQLPLSNMGKISQQRRSSHHLSVPAPSFPCRREKDTTRSLLNDKRPLADQRERYSHYSVVVEEVPVQPGEAQLYGEDYEDEYDDTYDGNQVGANDADSDDELISRR
ncbi:ASCC2 protein, partial [Odontophorus gujanensis]|nr:ASCC2 protein [Odontophorus gujanensis]